MVMQAGIQGAPPWIPAYVAIARGPQRITVDDLCPYPICSPCQIARQSGCRLHRRPDHRRRQHPRCDGLQHPGRRQSGPGPLCRHGGHAAGRVPGQLGLHERRHDQRPGHHGRLRAGQLRRRHAHGCDHHTGAAGGRDDGDRRPAATGPAAALHLQLGGDRLPHGCFHQRHSVAVGRLHRLFQRIHEQGGQGHRHILACRSMGSADDSHRLLDSGRDPAGRPDQAAQFLHAFWHADRLPGRDRSGLDRRCSR